MCQGLITTSDGTVRQGSSYHDGVSTTKIYSEKEVSIRSREGLPVAEFPGVKSTAVSW